MKRYIFPDPLAGAVCTLQPDSLSTPILGVSDLHPADGKPCVSFDVPSGIPTGNGAWLKIEWPPTLHLAPYALHGFLDTVTSGGGGFACDIFRGIKVSGSVRPFHLDGHFARYSDDNTEMLINDATGFRLFSRFVNGEMAQADAFCRSCVDHQINFVRVAAMQDTTLYLADPALRYRIHPDDHSNFYPLLDEFVGSYLAGWGLYVDLICCTQTRTLLTAPARQVAYVLGIFDVMHDKFGLVSKVNEQYVHDNTIEDALRLLPKPPGASFLLSNGSKATGDETPLDPIQDLIEYHTNDQFEWWRKGGHNSWEMAGRHHRATYPSEETRTDKDPSLIHYEDAGKSEAAMCFATMIHTPEGKNADPFNFSLAHVQAHNQGVFAVPLAQRRGAYQRYINPAVLREYSMGSYRWPVRF